MFFNQKQLEKIRQTYPPGTRVCLNNMNDPYAPILPGTEGVISMVDDAGQIHMKWDNGRSLALILGEDSFTVLQRPTPECDLKCEPKCELECEPNYEPKYDTKCKPECDLKKLNIKEQVEQQIESNQNLQMGGMKFE